MFEEFEKHSQGNDRGRFGASLAASLLFCACLSGGLVAASVAARTVVDEEDLVQVEFAMRDEPPPPPPAVTPAPLPPAPKPRVRRAPLAVPERIPEAKAAEADGPLGEAEPAQDPRAISDGPTVPAVVEAPLPAPEKPKSAGPVQLPEQATPPVAAAGNTPPEYPEEARKTGVQAVVIAKIVVRADGSVTQVDVLRGPPIFHAAVKAALMTWHYEPARLPDGTAISVFRIVQLPFKLENM